MGPTHNHEMCNFYLVFYGRYDASYSCGDGGWISRNLNVPLAAPLPNARMCERSLLLILLTFILCARMVAVFMIACLRFFSLSHTTLEGMAESFSTLSTFAKTFGAFASTTISSRARGSRSPAQTSNPTVTCALLLRTPLFSRTLLCPLPQCRLGISRRRPRRR